MAKQELVLTIRDRNKQPSKKEKGKILEEFTVITDHHRKHDIRLLIQPGYEDYGRRIYDEAVGEAVIVVWEASDHICGKCSRRRCPASYSPRSVQGLIG